MKRTHNSGKAEVNDWDQRAANMIVAAHRMPDGEEQVEALRKAKQFKVAAELRGYLASRELKPPQ